jgi:hypothetical protein
VYFSKEIPVQTLDGERRGRLASRVQRERERSRFCQIEGELVLRTTKSGRQQIKAFFMVDDRNVRSLTLQRFTVESGKPHEQAHFCLIGDEIGQLLELALLIKTSPLEGDEKARLTESDLQRMTLSKGAIRSLLKSDLRLIEEVVQQEVTERDIVAIAYRRGQLTRFERLLGEADYFESERARLECRGPEALWQRFFEENPWIFGYGLSYVYLTGLDHRKLEQVVAGYSVLQHGKRVDALLRSRGVISSLCFVEIKTHKTDLLESKPYRAGCWAASSELTGAVAQVQGTVSMATQSLRKLSGVDDQGNPTGEDSYGYMPKSFLVIGGLGEFMTEHGVNEERYRSFELFRRHTLSPEIITFDELYERARFIVQQHEVPGAS